ncbi:hypothetical protein IGS68_17960 [Skermanella sp. TT6]|uniref:Metallopeptidase DUF4344 n=1 Tax=Skermanella cutis TaxID=2775420 RepID=A0ABX7B276_9PROT|nr:DUF4344 domain-containing metallopeptidase [Skermanella sp. TT6]QQP87949.1 hypothetical protein IGS68_17960 [Skermanella sp. TT6]
MMGVRGGFRRLVAYIAVILSLAFPATARQVTAEERREADLFILGNTLFILYHELGHALIDLLGLPVLGHEEDAADNLASIMMIPDQPDPVMDELIVAAADGWYLGDLWQQEAGNAEPSWWGEHSLDMQRFYSVVCLMYGSDPAGFAELADSVNLPSDRRTSCAGDYQQARAGWSRLLAPHMLPAETRADRRSAVTLEFEPPAAGQDYVASLLHESGLIEAVVRDIGTGFKLPRDLTVRFHACGGSNANAFYHGGAAAVSVCYELVAFYNELILRDISRRHPR